MKTKALLVTIAMMSATLAGCTGSDGVAEIDDETDEIDKQQRRKQKNRMAAASSRKRQQDQRVVLEVAEELEFLIL